MYKQLIKEFVNLQQNQGQMMKPSQLQMILKYLDHETLSKYIKFNLAQIKIKSKLQYINLLHDPYDSFSIGIFILSQHQKLPLHDHPHMIVASKILCGEATLSSFDIDPNNQDDIQMKFPLKHYKLGLNINFEFDSIFRLKQQLVQLRRLPNKILSAGDIHLTKPNDSNIHQFNNIGDDIFAFIDVLIPNYDFKTRFCNFYEETNKPDQFNITGFPDDYEIENLDITIDLDKFKIARMPNKQFRTHPRDFGKDSRSCRVCNAKQGLIRRYGMNTCRRCFRDNYQLIGFQKYR